MAEFDAQKIDFDNRQTINKRPGAGRKKSAPSDDVREYLDAPPKAKGLLYKKSSKGKWQARWWELRGPYLMYWNSETNTGKPKPGNPVKMPLQALDCRRFATQSVVLKGARDNELHLTSSSGHVFSLKPYHTKHEDAMEGWRSQIEKQIMRFEAQSGQMAAIGQLEDDEAFDDAGDEEEEAGTGGGVQGKRSTRKPDSRAAASNEPLPASYAIENIWPNTFKVSIVLAEKDGTHPQYKVRIFKHGSQQEDGIKTRFGGFRELNNRITQLNDGTEINDKFPPTMSKQQWGFTLSPAEEQKRATDLNEWLASALSTEMKAEAAKELVSFLRVTDDRINPGQYTSLSSK